MEVIHYNEYPKAREWNAKVFSLPKIPRGEEGQPVVLRRILQSVIGKVPYSTRIKFEGSNSKATLDELCVWLRPVGLVYKDGGTWEVSIEGKRWLDTEDDLYLTAIFCANVRFMAELLVRLNEPKKISELQQIAKEEYNLHLETNSEINNRLMWLRQLDLVEFTDYLLTYSLTEKGKEFAENIFYVKPDEIIIDTDPTINEIEIPVSNWGLEICQLTQEKLKTRKPSIGYIPGSISEVCDTTAGYIQLMHTAIDQESIISYSQNTYDIAISSARSFISTLTTLEMVERKTKTLYEATDLGRKWLATKSQLDLLCILQIKVFFIFEMLKELEKNSLSVKGLAAIAKVSYGFETEKIDEIRKRITIMRGALLIQEDGPELYCLTERGRKLLELITV